MDLSFANNRVTESDKAEAQEQLLKGQPVFLEIDEIVSEQEVAGLLVLGAFGAPPDTKVHIKQLRTHSHIDSLSRHIKGSDYMPPLRKGDIVTFDRVFIDGGDGMTNRITSRTHDGMRGNVQFHMAMARASVTNVNKRGAQQFLTIADGSSAFRAENEDDIRDAHRLILGMDWTANSGGFIARTPEGMTFEYHVGRDNPLNAFIEDVNARGTFSDGGWLELIPARRFPVGREQVARDVDVKQEATRKIGAVGGWYFAAKSRFPGFRQTGVILCDEEEWAFGGKTGKIQRVAAGIQPLNREVPVDSRYLPSRIKPKFGKVRGITALYSQQAMERLAAERAVRRPPEPETPAPSRRPPQGCRGGHGNRVDTREDEAPRPSAMPFSFGPGGTLKG